MSLRASQRHSSTVRSTWARCRQAHIERHLAGQQMRQDAQLCAKRRLCGLRLGPASADHHLQLLELASALCEHHPDVLLVCRVSHHVDLPPRMLPYLLPPLQVERLSGAQHIAVQRPYLCSQHKLLQRRDARWQAGSGGRHRLRVRDADDRACTHSASILGRQKLEGRTFGCALGSLVSCCAVRTGPEVRAACEIEWLRRAASRSHSAHCRLPDWFLARLGSVPFHSTPLHSTPDSTLVPSVDSTLQLCSVALSFESAGVAPARCDGRVVH